MNIYASLADDYYCNMNLNTEMVLPDARETILGFFERVQKAYPTMRNFYTREAGHFVLEEDKDTGQQRWLSVEPQRIASGCVNPSDLDAAMEQHLLTLNLVPYMLSVSPLDCDALDFMVGFDFEYCGNHDQLVAESLGGSAATRTLLGLPGSRVLNYEPAITIALDESCRLQARLAIETRTTAYQVRRGEYDASPISVYFTVRQYGSLDPGVSFEDVLRTLRARCEELLDEYVIEHVLRPLAHAISAR